MYVHFTPLLSNVIEQKFDFEFVITGTTLRIDLCQTKIKGFLFYTVLTSELTCLFRTEITIPDKQSSFQVFSRCSQRFKRPFST